MLERFGLGDLGIEDFPEATFALSAIMVAVFLFTRTNIDYFENIFGFIPLHPQIYAFITYTFIHVDFTHIFFNVLFLLIAGIAIEQTLGKWVFLAIYFSSGNIAVIFDILGRFLSGISFSVPFVGASGAIFGVLAVAAFIKPMEKSPIIFALLALVPLAQWTISSIPGLGLTSQVDLLVTVAIVMAAMMLVFLLPGSVPVFLTMVMFLLSWMVIILLRLPTAVSNLGHLGGVVGGIASFFIFAKKSEDRKKT